MLSFGQQKETVKPVLPDTLTFSAKMEMYRKMADEAVKKDSFLVVTYIISQEPSEGRVQVAKDTYKRKLVYEPQMQIKWVYPKYTEEQFLQFVKEQENNKDVKK
jgi:hypothetical protein